MGKRRRLYRLGDDVYLLASERPRKVDPETAAKVLSGTLEGRRVSLGGSYLNAAARKTRAQRAARARWSRREKA